MTLVIVEDEIWVRQALIDAVPWDDLGLRLLGEAESGPEAYELCKEMMPDIVMTDLRIPGFDGLELIRKLREGSPDSTKYIIVSGHSEFRRAQEAIRLSVDEYLLKPVTDEMMRSSLRTVVDKISAERSRKSGAEKYRRENVALKRILLERGVPGNAADESFNECDDLRIRKCLTLINSDPSKPWMLEEAAEAVGMSRSNFALRFKESVGVSFLRYVTDMKMKMAAELLRNPELPISDIADMLGYADANYFTKAFRRHFLNTPTRYRADL